MSKNNECNHPLSELHETEQGMIVCGICGYAEILPVINGGCHVFLDGKFMGRYSTGKIRMTKQGRIETTIHEFFSFKEKVKEDNQ